MTKKCFTCNKAVSLEKIRKHLAYHLLSGHIENGCNVCGYCGQSSCHSTLKKTRFVKKTTTQYYKIQSNCPYFIFHHKTPRTLTTRNRCTNHLLVCPVSSWPCKLPVWKYNLEEHYRGTHENLVVPEELTISNQEKQLLLA